MEDSGPGIAPAFRERALARFDRSGQAPTSGTNAVSGVPGSGLGLAIVKAIAERHGADLKLDRSERLGGLKVAVAFPAAS